MPAGSAATMAHEMGHNFAFEHDDQIGSCTCEDPSGNCIMYSRTRSVILLPYFYSHSVYKGVP